MRFFLEGNKEEVRFSASHLPMLISGKQGSGASFFSLSLISQLFLNGERVLFFTLLPQATDLFIQQCSSKQEDIFILKDISRLSEAKNYQAILVLSGNMSLFEKILMQLPDIKERVIFIKNIEDTVNENIYQSVQDADRIILAGNIDGSPLKWELAGMFFKSKIVFSLTEVDLDVEVPRLPEKRGYIVSGGLRGIIEVAD